MAEQDGDTFEITTTAQCERTYSVLAADEEQANKRLRMFLNDPDLVREGLVTEIDGRRRDTTTQKRVSIKKVGKPRAVKDAVKDAAEAS